MPINDIQIKTAGKLLEQVEKISIDNKKISILKGESFNIFSILNLESSENKTHSAFIGELLNPKGSHMRGSVFLKLFINNTLGKENFEINDRVSVSLEKDIGRIVNNNYTGGRIDIYITNGKNQISIENKIFATDQPDQIKRYCNHEKKTNTVYYLTLNGNEPSKQSRHTLEVGKHYYLISYRETIIQWLELCMKESADSPILRESIKQYIILIKKLTGQLTNNKMEEELKNLIFKNLESAKLIHRNYESAVNGAIENFRELIKEHIEISYNNDNKFNISLNRITNINSNIFISHRLGNLKIGIEPFNGSGHLKQLQIGFWRDRDLVNHIRINKYIEEHNWNQNTNQWFNLHYLGIDFNEFEHISKIARVKTKEEILSEVKNKIDNFFNNHLTDFYALENLVQ